MHQTIDRHHVLVLRPAQDVDNVHGLGRTLYRVNARLIFRRQKHDVRNADIDRDARAWIVGRNPLETFSEAKQSI